MTWFGHLVRGGIADAGRHMYDVVHTVHGLHGASVVEYLIAFGIDQSEVFAVGRYERTIDGLACGISLSLCFLGGADEHQFAQVLHLCGNQFVENVLLGVYKL